MDQAIKEKMDAALPDIRLPRYREIPDVGLYLEQVTKYVSDSLAPLGQGAVTGSMVSNYVKKGILASPVRKQYGREQIAHLIYITVVKSVLPMEDIRLMLSIQKRTYDSAVAYDYFCTELENMLRFIFGLKDSVDEVGVTTSEAKDMLRSVIIAVAHVIYLNSRFDAMAAAQKEQEDGEQQSAPGEKAE